MGLVLQFYLASRGDNPQAPIQSFNQQFQPGEQEQEAVAWCWLWEPGNTMFHLGNPRTHSIQGKGYDFKVGTRLAALNFAE